MTDTAADTILKRNNVRVIGEGSRTMLLAHGFGCDQTVWRFVVPMLQEEYRLVLMDYTGSGKSDASAYRPSRYQSLDGYASDVLDVCAALDLRDVVFVGHSVSGMIGVLASLREPERFARLVMVCPSPRYLNDLPDYVGGFERDDIEGLLDLMEKNPLGWQGFLAPLVMGEQDSGELTEELHDSFCSLAPEIAHQFASVTFLSDNRDDLAEVAVPSLILQSRIDAIAPMSVGTYLHENLPTTTLEILDNNGHCPHMSAPGETARRILSYLDGPPS